jgi:hypothetical protein
MDPSDILSYVYPVGSIYMSVNNVNPSTLFGGTWEAWGSGRVPVGVNTNDANFNSVEKTGGTSAVLLTSTQSGVPAHSHGLANHTHSVGAHSHGLNEHTHSVGAHHHGLNNHTHSVPSTKVTLYKNTNNAGTSTSSPSYTNDVVVTQNTGKTTNAFAWTAAATSGGNSGNTADSAAFNTGKASGSTANSTAFNTGAASGNTADNTAANAIEAHTNLQPYITCYMWKRTA